MKLLNMRTSIAIHHLGVGIGLWALSSCALIEDNKEPGWEYAPQMYVSTPYEPYSQVKKNSINADGKNMRAPVSGTIARNSVGYDNTILELMHNYPIGRDSVDYAGKILRNPLDYQDTTLLAEGKYLYGVFCSSCHGDQGNGQGKVGLKYAGVPNYKDSRIPGLPSGHIYHVITLGKNRMWGLGSQIRPEDRWKIVLYVNQLRGYKEPS
ncbi:MAG: cytochrome c [Sphingomonadales bacterium]|nr:cytochrome c [Sphingomonadales bacterium]MBM3923360.1 cytochrome c [Sphingomonadales bacterium]MBM3931401.1 cytochrome c [Sphingomonadales bacterium]